MMWKHFLHNWPIVIGIHWLSMDSPHQGPVMKRFGLYSAVNLNKSCPTNSLFVSDLRCHITHVTLIWYLTLILCRPGFCICLNENGCILIRISLNLFLRIQLIFQSLLFLFMFNTSSQPSHYLKPSLTNIIASASLNGLSELPLMWIFIKYRLIELYYWFIIYNADNSYKVVGMKP